MAGTTRETVTRVLNRLEAEGYIRCNGRRILVYNEAYDERASVDGGRISGSPRDSCFA